MNKVPLVSGLLSNNNNNNMIADVLNLLLLEKAWVVQLLARF